MVQTVFLEMALVTIPITFTPSAISATAGFALTLQSAPVHRRGNSTIKWPRKAFCFIIFCHFYSTLQIANEFACNKQEECPRRDKEDELLGGFGDKTRQVRVVMY